MRTLALAIVACFFLAGCRGEGPPGKNSAKDRQRPPTEEAPVKTAPATEPAK